uniref:Brain-enriched guanylate kinase-associated protein n=1 Tax=Biomphalaria glabrata TaxID=6526 RepID=A0A2C9L4F3_BIOGL
MKMSECGCRCDSCGNRADSYQSCPNSLDLHQQIAELHSQLQRSNSHISNIEHELLDNKQAMDVELAKTREDLSRLRERYERLLESHKKMQKINHDLEDKLLKMPWLGIFENEKLSLQTEISSVMNKLVDARILINQLDEESERYRMDCNTAVQLLQCKPSNFVSHKLNTLPIDLQDRLRQHMTREQIMAAENGVSMQEEQKLIRVPMATFPPCAMVFSLNQNINKPSDQHNESDASKGFVPMSLITRVLTQRESRKTYPRMFLCMACKKDVFHEDKGCQVDLLPTTPRSVEITSRPTVERSQSFIHSLSPRNSMNSLRGGNNFNFSSKEYSTSTSLENDY